jgi:uncharacterized protein
MTQPPYSGDPNPGPMPSRAGPPYPPARSPEERGWASAAHWSALVAAFVVLSFVGPLIVMLAHTHPSPFVRRHTTESLNFQISVLLYAAVSFVLAFVLVGIFLLIGLGIMWLICTVIGAVKAASGEDFRYPLTIRLVS